MKEAFFLTCLMVVASVVAAFALDWAVQRLMGRGGGLDDI